MRVVEDADPYISHQYSGERVGGGVPDAPFISAFVGDLTN